MKKLLLWLFTAIFLFLYSGINASAAEYKFSMSYIYFGDSTAYTALVDSARGSLDEVAPNYFELDNSGNLSLTNAVSHAFVDAMHTRGIRVVPYLSNDWVSTSGIQALANRDVLSSSLAGAVAEYGLDGVNIDLENLNQNQRADYVDFVRLLREKLPPGKTIAVAVAANPAGRVTGWQGSYDYSGLAQYSDYLMIMAYDEHYEGSVPGSVSSISFVERSITYALDKVPKEKIVLGLPFYGRIWSLGGGSPRGYGISNTKISSLLSKYQSTVFTDSDSQSACAVVTVEAGQTKPVVGGSPLSAGSYLIWYENEQTLKERLNLVHEYGLKGAGSWSLGQEDKALWNGYKLSLNGCKFGDAEASWARDYILNAYIKGWVNGTTSDTFSPDAPMTRAEAAAMLIRMLGYPVAVNPDLSFSDTKGSWAEAYIDTARQYGLITGAGGNLFAPDMVVTRQEIAVMLGNIRGDKGAVSEAAFGDVNKEDNSWSYEAIAALSADGVITGFPDGTFRPEASLTRAEMTALLSRMQKT